MKVTVIIPNYNGVRFLPDCLVSLRRQTFTDFSVMVVDNGSSDESIHFLAEAYPEVQVIALNRNRGFAYAVNAGIRASNTPFILLLNNDTILKPDCLAHLLKGISKSEHIFSAGARVVQMNDPQLMDTTGDFYSLFGYAFCRGQGISDYPRTSGEVFTNCGCAVLYRRALLAKTGLFDPEFFAYLEDVDLGMRARRLGYRNLYVPEAVVRHVGSGTTGAKYTEFKVFYSARNNFWLRRKNLTVAQRILHAPFFATGLLLKYFFFRKLGLQRAYRKGCLRGMSGHAAADTPEAYRYTVAAPPEACPKGLPSFFRTEPWIWYGTVLYIRQFLRRKLR